MVSVSFSGIFPSVRPLKKVGGIADRVRYMGTLLCVSVSFWGGVQRSISHSKGVSKTETPFPVGGEQNGTPLPLPIPARLFCPFLPEHGGKVGFDLLQFGGSGFLLPVFSVKPVFLGNQGFIFRLQLGNSGQLLQALLPKIPHRRFIQRQVCVKCFRYRSGFLAVFSPSWAGLVLR